MEYDCKPDAKTIKKETEFEGGFAPVDKRVSALFWKNFEPVEVQ